MPKLAGSTRGLFNTIEPFKQMCYIVSNVAFAYGGVELFGLAAVETASPKNQSIVPENKFFIDSWCFIFCPLL